MMLVNFLFNVQLLYFSISFTIHNELGQSPQGPWTCVFSSSQPCSMALTLISALVKPRLPPRQSGLLESWWCRSRRLVVVVVVVPFWIEGSPHSLTQHSCFQTVTPKKNFFFKFFFFFQNFFFFSKIFFFKIFFFKNSPQIFPLKCSAALTLISGLVPAAHRTVANGSVCRCNK